MFTTAIIVAAGRGQRAGGDKPKQYQPLGGRAVLARSVEAMARHPGVQAVVLVVHPGDGDLLGDLGLGDVGTVFGGATRSASVLAGLGAVPADTTHVLIHDGARPLVSDAVTGAVIAALTDHAAAAPALAVTDALWRGDEGRVRAIQPREGLWRAQTPQGFELSAIRAAHQTATGAAADDVELALAAGLDVAIVAGEERNIKITFAADFARAERLLKDAEMTTPDIRTGNGFDVHRFGPGDHVILCGVKVPHERTLQGHSDADVGMHAVTDAIYGALGDGDIGQHFPPSDPQWKGAASEIFLRHAVELAAGRGFTLTHADCTLICEEPKIGPHAKAMKAVMAALLGISGDRVSVKATTSERLGFTGRGEGIAALATVTLVRP